MYTYSYISYIYICIRRGCIHTRACCSKESCVMSCMEVLKPSSLHIDSYSLAFALHDLCCDFLLYCMPLSVGGGLSPCQ